MHFAQLLLRHFTRRAEQKILGVRIHREGDHFADILFIPQQHQHPVNARRHARVRRSAILERVVERTEPRLHILGRVTGQLKALTIMSGRWLRTAPEESSTPLQTISY